MPSLARLKGTRKRHLYYRRRFSEQEFEGFHERHRANGRIASLGWAYCGRCGHEETWLSPPWLNNDIVCSCGGSVCVVLRGLQREDAAWRDHDGIIHRVEIDHGCGTITACYRPIEHDQRSLDAFVGAAAPNCFSCISAVLKAA